MASRASRPRVTWMWKSDSTPWGSSGSEQWTSYSDVETAIIEEAYQKKSPEVLLDEYHINFKNMVQISNKNESHQRPIKRADRSQLSSQVKLREERFTANPIHPATPFADQRALLSFNNEFYKIYDIIEDTSLNKPETRRMMVEKAAEGIITEGKLVGKQKEAEWMAQELLKAKNSTDKELWEVCAHLYTMESFLYKKMNEYMRLCGDKSQLDVWKRKIATFGPLAYLISMLTYNPDYKKLYVYRGANLSDDLIQKYRDNIGAYMMFPACTSTSRNKAVAEQFGNVLFVLHVSTMDGFDVSPYSDFPEEEEMLLKSDYAFYIRSCTFDNNKKK